MHVGFRAQGHPRGDKWAVPRHRVLSRQGASAQERAIERRVRQASRKLCRQEV